MNINIEKLSEMIEKLVIFELIKSLPGNKIIHLRSLFRFIKNFYKDVPPENIHGNFYILFSEDKKDYPFLDRNLCFRVKDGFIYEIIKFPALLLLFDDGDYLLWNEKEINLEEVISENGLAYELNEHCENVWVGRKIYKLEKSPLNSRSLFSPPTYWDLETAFNNYYIQMAKKATCHILKKAWADNRRLRWRNSPEHYMRDSLWQYLRGTLRGAEVKREQNVTDDNPIDIKVTWNFSRARGLIEIKWLGVSINDFGEVTSDYTESRAKYGAKQLKNYIDLSLSENRDLDFIGYLVVFDGRRKRIRNLSNEKITKEDAWAYKYKEIQYPEEYINRRDLELKYRFFIEPNVN